MTPTVLAMKFFREMMSNAIKWIIYQLLTFTFLLMYGLENFHIFMRFSYESWRTENAFFLLKKSVLFLSRD